MDISVGFSSPITQLSTTRLEAPTRAPNSVENTSPPRRQPLTQPSNAGDNLSLTDSPENTEPDPIETFLALGRQKQTQETQNPPLKTLETVIAEREQSVEDDQAEAALANLESEEAITETSRDFDLLNVAGDPAAILKKSEEIQRQAQARGGDLSAAEQVAVDKARRLGIQARFELEKAEREAQREVRDAELKAERREAEEQRRAAIPSPFRRITTPFDIVEEIEPVVTLGTSINIQA